MQEWTVISFYQFVAILDPSAFKKRLEDFFEGKDFCGTILVAPEGINSTMAGSLEGIKNFLSFLKSQPGLENLIHKESKTTRQPFYRMKVRLKKEIVTMGVPDCKPGEKTGILVKAQDWNDLIQDPEVLLIDTRNDYEVEIGSFKGAINPKTQHFSHFVDYIQEKLKDKKNQKIAMFCTGGIRCEKATSYMLDQGFQKVYQLEGGILKYLEEVSSEESAWEGECFVFDNRVTVNHDLKKGEYELCYACREPLSLQDQESSQYQKGISCPRCFDKLSQLKRSALQERQKQVQLAKERGSLHLGWKKPKNRAARRAN
ncbi:MAG: rhodanese-related sulfurtransferase [Deltaproteobacteria bacterium]|nr:rhodanese-related sulfurtransferase [Deltaproteobacteria bacterium]